MKKLFLLLVIINLSADVLSADMTIDSSGNVGIGETYPGAKLDVDTTDTYGLAVVEKTRERIVVRELMNNKRNFTFDYFVTAVRAGFEEFEPVVTNTHFKPQANETAEEFEARYAKDVVTTKAIRSMLIANGILTEEGKLNMTMVEKTGWVVAEKKSVPWH